MAPTKTGRWLIPLLLIALSLRLFGLDWDQFEHFHPDERYIAWVATTVEFGGHERWGAWINPQASDWNPYLWPERETVEGVIVPKGEPRRFAYGHLPLYMGVGLTRLAELVPKGFLPDWALMRWLFNLEGENEFVHITAVGRAMTAMIDTLTVACIYWLGRLLFPDRRIALLGAVFLTFTVLHIQHAHFWVTDSTMTFFMVLTITCLAAAVVQPERRMIWLSGAAVGWGLALGAKATSAFLGIPVLVAVISLRKWQFWRPAVGVGLGALLVFALTNPFAILDWSCANELPIGNTGRVIPISSCLLENLGRESGMVRGDLSFPFVRQYDGTTAYGYPILNQLRWGIGWPLGILVFAGFFACAGRLGQTFWKYRNWRSGSLESHAILMVMLWCLAYFGLTGGLHTKYMRYFLPLTPFLMLFGAWLIFQFERPWLRRSLLAAVLVPTVVYAAAFVNMYRTPHPWVQVTEEIYCRFDGSMTVANELWDQGLPVNLNDSGPCPDFRPSIVELNWLSRPFDRDNEEKLNANLEQLAAADVVIIASGRSYAHVHRLPETYPTSSGVHEKLLAGELGFEIVYVADRAPNLFGLYLMPDRFDWAGLETPPAVQAHFDGRLQWTGGPVDENYTVYDQPLAMILVNRERLTAEALRERVSNE